MFTGTAAWTGDYFLELRDDVGTWLDYADLGTTRPGATKTTGFTLTLPEHPGVYTYTFTALQHGREYFGPEVLRAIVVRKPPLDVSLAVTHAAIFVGQRTTVRSAAERAKKAATKICLASARWPTISGRWRGFARTRPWTISPGTIVRIGAPWA